MLNSGTLLFVQLFSSKTGIVFANKELSSLLDVPLNKVNESLLLWTLSFPDVQKPRSLLIMSMDVLAVSSLIMLSFVFLPNLMS